MVIKNLRPYQLEAKLAILDFIASKTRSGLVVCPPGAGKTVIMASALAESCKQYSILWLAHNITLLQQAAETCKNLGIKDFRGVSGSWNVHEGSNLSDAIFASIFIDSSKLLEALRHTKRRGLIVVIDEAHHEAADSYGSTLAVVGSRARKKIGLTATPFRLDAKELSFSKVIYSIDMLKLIEDGYLVPAEYHRVETKLKSGLELAGADYSKATLKALHKADRAAIVAKTYSPAKHGRTIIFLPTVEACAVQVRAFEQFKPKVRVAMITAETPQDTRTKLIKQFREGKIQVICNVAVFSEGVDIPEVQTVFLARPTASKALYVQQVGRGSRLAPNKDKYKIVDFVDMDIPHFEYLSAIWRNELFGHKLPEDVEIRKRKKEKLEKLKELKINKSRLRWLYTEDHLLYLYGILQYKYKNAVSYTSAAITSYNYKAILSTIKYLDQNRSGGAVNETYSYFGYQILPALKWFSMAWAIKRGDYRIISIDPAPVFNFESYLEEQKKLAKQAETLLEDLIEHGLFDDPMVMRAMGLIDGLPVNIQYQLSGRLLILEGQTDYKRAGWLSKIVTERAGMKIAVVYSSRLWKPRSYWKT